MHLKSCPPTLGLTFSQLWNEGFELLIPEDHQASNQGRFAKPFPFEGLCGGGGIVSFHHCHGPSRGHSTQALGPRNSFLSLPGASDKCPSGSRGGRIPSCSERQGGQASTPAPQNPAPPLCMGLAACQNVASASASPCQGRLP